MPLKISTLLVQIMLMMKILMLLMLMLQLLMLLMLMLLIMLTLMILMDRLSEFHQFVIISETIDISIISLKEFEARDMFCPRTRLPISHLFRLLKG